MLLIILLFRMADSTVSPARQLAYRALTRIDQTEAYVDQVDIGGTPRQRRQARDVVAGVTRQQRWLWFLITQLYNGNPNDLEPPVTRILKMGLYELLFQSTPARAAVHQYVELAKDVVGMRVSGLVNGILRTADRQHNDLPRPDTGDAERDLAIRTSMPTWLVRRWGDARGFAETEALLHRLNERPTYALHLLDAAPADLDALGVSWTPSPYVNGMVRVEALQPIVQAGWLDDGRAIVQGEGAALVVDLLDAEPGATVLDLCAAPGTKTRLIAHRMDEQGRVWANDHSAHRLQALQEVPSRLDIIETHTADARTLSPDDAPESPTHVLLDVPCTGTGVLGRRADLRWRRTPSDVPELVALQDELLEAAARLVPAEGILVYSTCSLLPEENEERVHAFLDRHDDFELRVPTHLPSDVQHNGFLQTDPVAHGTDGAFGARLRRRAA